MLIVGITGGIGSGKSTVTSTFKQLGIDVVDADFAARKVVEKGSPALQKIAEHFGTTVIQADGSLDRAAMRSLVFNNPQQKQWLEQLLHPLIREWIEQRLQQVTSPYAILESPLLLETDQHQMVDRVLLVDIPEEQQIARAAARDNNTEQQIKAIMQTQMSRQARCEKADDILDNSGSPENSREQVLQLHRRYLAMADNSNHGNPS